MPIDLVITELCVQFVCQGEINAAEVKDAYELAWADPNFRVGTPYYVDLPHGTIAQFEGDDPSSITDFIIRRLDQHGRVKTAFLCERDVDHGVARMFQAYADLRADLPVRVCQSEEDALAWLRGEVV